MRSALVALSLIAITPLWFPYGSLIPHEPGNPDYHSYNGEAGSTYDAKANPPQTVGTVNYDPTAPLPPVSPSAPSGSGAMMP